MEYLPDYCTCFEKYYGIKVNDVHICFHPKVYSIEHKSDEQYQKYYFDFETDHEYMNNEEESYDWW